MQKRSVVQFELQLLGKKKQKESFKNLHA
jgi:hypothetical protein